MLLPVPASSSEWQAPFALVAASPDDDVALAEVQALSSQGVELRTRRTEPRD